MTGVNGVLAYLSLRGSRGSGPAGGAEGVRTPDLLNAIQALYQLSYDPVQSVQNVR